jgi:hypothetical protein
MIFTPPGVRHQPKHADQPWHSEIMRWHREIPEGAAGYEPAACGFDLKDTLKRRGYRWSDGSDGRPRSWYVDVDEIALDDEIAFLKTEIYLRDVEPRLQTLTAFTRFSIRA